MHASLRVIAASLLVGITLIGCQNEDTAVEPIEPAEALDQSVSKAELDADEQILGKLPSSVREITGPTVITEPGIYRLTRDFSFTDPTGDAIVVQAHHVLLDLRNHTITGPGNKAGRGIVLEGAKNVVVKNGTLSTFGLGVALNDVSKSAVRRLKIMGGDETANPAAGNPPQIGIMLVNSYDNRIARNWMQLVNLGIFVRGSGSFQNNINGNEVTGGFNGLLGICYNPAPGFDAATDGPSHDRVRFNLLQRFRTGIQTNAAAENNLFAHNTIKYFVSPYEDLNGTNTFRRNNSILITP